MWRVELIALLFIAAGLKPGFGRQVTYQDHRLYRGSKCELNDGSEGICSSECAIDPVVRREAKVCNFEGGDILLCCRTNQDNASYPTIEKICQDQIEAFQTVDRQFEADARWLRETNARYLREWEEEYRKCIESRTRPSIIVDLIEYDTPRPGAQVRCGSTAPKKIHPFSPIHPALLGEHLHMVSLGWTLRDKSTEWDCGGTLIHPKFVITAAHCLENKGREPDKVFIGGVDLTVIPRILHMETRVEKAFKHPNYTSTENYNDIAILKVGEPKGINGGPVARIACLWKEKEIPYAKLLAMGFGAPEFGRAYTNKLYQGNLTLVGLEECNRFYANMTELPQGIVESQICAYDPEGVLDSCEGDSGGPLQFNDEGPYKLAHLVGIISFGPPCRTGTPGVYTRISSFLSWIEDVLSKEISD